jgi:hypothetical protein
MNYAIINDRAGKFLEIIKPVGYVNIDAFTNAMENMKYKKYRFMTKTARNYILSLGTNRPIPAKFLKAIFALPRLQKEQKTKISLLFKEDEAQKKEMKVSFSSKGFF